MIKVIIDTILGTRVEAECEWPGSAFYIAKLATNDDFFNSVRVYEGDHIIAQAYKSEGGKLR